MCFMNAFDLANEDTGDRDTRVIYCEGYALSSVMPIHHAWVVTRDGRVIDHTWEEPGIEYVGIPIDMRWLRSLVCETGVYGVLNDFTSTRFLMNGLPPEAVSEVAFPITA